MSDQVSKLDGGDMQAINFERTGTTEQVSELIGICREVRENLT